MALLCTTNNPSFVVRRHVEQYPVVHPLIAAALGEARSGADSWGGGRRRISSKLARGTFAATFLLACLAALEMEGIQLADL